jgi:hydroxymethylpyrimidine/phosphomethylpyrimidine kinase
MIPMALTIAGSDSSAGAGIQADLKTFASLGVYGASAITAITAQNTQGVRGVHAVPPAMVGQQIDAVLEDLAIGAIKIGMVFSADIVDAIADSLAKHAPRPLVLDPVMIATSGDRLIDATAAATLVRRLFPLSALTGQPLATSEPAMQAQAHAILALGATAVLMKGGHATGDHSVDLLVTATATHSFTAPRIATQNLHGTGCTLSAAIAAELSRGCDLPTSVARAKRYLTAAILAAVDRRIGNGHGPVHHFHAHDALAVDHPGLDTDKATP